MILCPINPVKQIEWSYEKPYVMILAHLTKYPEYVAIANNSEQSDVYKIMDNSLIELGEAFGIADVYEAATKLHPQEIILPDVFQDGPATIKAVNDAIEWLRENNHLGEFNLMAVAHGKTEEEFKATFDALNAIPEVTCIGIPKILSTWCKDANRASLYHIWGNTDKAIHLLGSWYNLKELLDMPMEQDSKTLTSCPQKLCYRNIGNLDNF